MCFLFCANMFFQALVGITLLFQDVSLAGALTECGILTPEAMPLTLEGVRPVRGAVPWHAVIYKKTETTPRALCAGSIVSADKIITAAHCVTTPLENKPLPALQLAAAVGKLYSDWDNSADDTAQKSDVTEVHIPPRFVGIAANLQDDIALLVTKPFQLNRFVRPVCIDFDHNLEKNILKSGIKGKVSGWMSTSGVSSPLSLQTAEMSYIDLPTCVAQAEPEFREFITSDKLCAKATESRSLCRGDSGAGLAFPISHQGIYRYYLYGVASTSPVSDDGCATNNSLFTQTTKHQEFLKPLLA